MGRNFVWRLQRQVWWWRQPRTGTAAAGPSLAARFHDCGFPQGDCAYNAVLAASDGAIYFAIGTHRPDTAARLFRFDPALRAVEDCGDVAGDGEAGEPPAIAHGKVHVPFLESRGEIHLATHVGFYRRDGRIERPASHPGFRPFAGGRFLAYGLATGCMRDLARAPVGEGVLTLQIDRARRRLFGVTWPGGLLLCLDLASGALANHGPIFGLGERGDPARGSWEAIGRDLALDPEDGRLYWSRQSGRIECLDASGARTVLDVRLPTRRRRSGAWRRIVWHPRERAFFGVTVAGRVLFRFDPRAGRLDPIAALDPARLQGGFTREPLPTLAFELDVGRDEIRSLVLGPGIAGHRGRRTRSTLEFVTASLDGAVRSHGTLRLEDGRYPTVAQGLASRDGICYAPAWIELPADDPTPRTRELRAVHAARAAGEIHGQAEEIGLISFPDPRGTGD